MGKKSKIAWTEATWNPWIGCEKVSEGCRHCYAEAQEKRWHNDDFGTLKRTAPATWGGPIHWDHKAEQDGKRLRVFTCSLSDFFHPQADQWRAEAWDVIRRTPNLDWMILTKRPERIAACLPPGWYDDFGWPNVSLGVTIENQERANERLPILMDLPTMLKFVSAEPLLEYVSLKTADPDWDDLSLVIVGGETGSKDRRPLHESHLNALRRECEAVGVPFLFKGWERTRPAMDDGDLFGQISAIIKTRIQGLEMAKNKMETKAVRSCATCPMADLSKDWCYHHRASIRQMDGPGLRCPFPMEREGVLFVIEQGARNASD